MRESEREGGREGERGGDERDVWSAGVGSRPRAITLEQPERQMHSLHAQHPSIGTQATSQRNGRTRPSTTLGSVVRRELAARRTTQDRGITVQSSLCQHDGTTNHPLTQSPHNSSAHYITSSHRKYQFEWW